MRGLLTVALVMLAGCGGSPSAAREGGPTAFPNAGRYEVTLDAPPGSHSTIEQIDVSNRAAFEKMIADLVSHCRNQQITIGNGTFHASATCDASDGDIHNVGLEISGTYSATSIDLAQDINLWGHRSRTSYHYRYLGK